MKHQYMRGILLLAFGWVTSGAILAADPVGKGNTSSADADFPATYAGRTFQEWKRTLKDLDEATRQPAYSAMAAFARNGYEKEAIVAIETALAKEESRAGFSQGYQAAKKIGKAAEPLLVRGLNQPDERSLNALLETLETAGLNAPGDPLVAALLEKAQSRELKPYLREQACRALAVQVMAHAFSGSDSAKSIRQLNPTVGPQLKQIVPVLENLLKDQDVRIGNAAAVGLLKISILQPKLVATFLDYLDSELTNPRSAPVATTAVATAAPSRPAPPPRPVAVPPAGKEAMNGLRARREGIGRPQISHQNLYVIQLLNELQQFMAQPGAHEALLPSITHLSSLRDRHPTANYYMNLVIDELDQNQVRQGRPSMRAAPTLLPHDSFN